MNIFNENGKQHSVRMLLTKTHDCTTVHTTPDQIQGFFDLARVHVNLLEPLENLGHAGG
jgi:hypothetical protein